ncbi:hypothetical protein [Streptomyces alboflavus]|nr:hypothetical protein [Streptomyces alboflavus]
MPDRPYTDADLRTEAARQYLTATEDPDYMGIGEQMDQAFIESTVVDPDPETGTEPVTGTTWDQLTSHDFQEAQRGIRRLLDGAADVSEWAINLGADGLEPSGYIVTLGPTERPSARLHFAFGPDMPEDTRIELVARLDRILTHGL